MVAQIFCEIFFRIKYNGERSQLKDIDRGFYLRTCELRPVAGYFLKLAVQGPLFAGTKA